MTHADLLRILVDRRNAELRRNAALRRLLRERRIAAGAPVRAN